MLKNDAGVLSAVSDFRSPVAATSNFISLVTAAASDQKKAKRQANEESKRKKTDPKKLKKQASETAGHSMSLPNGLDDHNDFDDLVYLGHEGQHQPSHHQYETRQTAAAGMSSTQPNKDEETGVDDQQKVAR